MRRVSVFIGHPLVETYLQSVKLSGIEGLTLDAADFERKNNEPLNADAR